MAKYQDRTGLSSTGAVHCSVTILGFALIVSSLVHGITSKAVHIDKLINGHQMII